MGCTRLCEEIGFSNGQYKSGHKYCSKCEIFMITEDLSCPAAKKRLRYTVHRKLTILQNIKKTAPVVDIVWKQSGLARFIIRMKSKR
jgi:hypothetical protein